MECKVLDMLAIELKRAYLGKYSYAVDVHVKALRKTIDNNKDALETILNICEHFGERCSLKDLLKELDEDWGDGMPASAEC